MIATIDLGVWKNGEFVTKYSNWTEWKFEGEHEARVFARGIVCGLEYKWKMAACRLRFKGGGEEVFY